MKKLFCGKKQYLILGVIFVIVAFGLCFRMISGRKETKMPEVVSVTEEAITPESGSLQNDNEVADKPAEDLPVFYVEAMETTELKEPFDIQNYYRTNHVTVRNHFFIDEDNVLWGSGGNTFGQLGISEPESFDTTYTEPVKIAENVISVDASDYFCIYLTADGKLYKTDANPVLLMEDVAYASAGQKSISALKKDGSVWWWGEYSTTYVTKDIPGMWFEYTKNEENENNPIKMLYLQPKKMLEDCIYTVSGNWSGAAITSKGELYTWGSNIFGQCGAAVTEDDYLRTPTKVLDNVNMVWFERIENGSPVGGTQEIIRNNTIYNFSTFVQLKDGTMLAAGKDLGEKEKTIEITGDIATPSTHIYSDEFIPIELKVYSEEETRAKLDKLEWGMTLEEVENFLDQESLCYKYTVGPSKLSEDELIIKGLIVEYDSYFLNFDDDGRLHKIKLSIGGSRNGRFSMGMTLEEVQALLDCDLICEETEDTDSCMYRTGEAVDGRYFRFLFSGETEKTLSEIFEMEAIQN